MAGEIALFLAQAALISLSGVMAPGPVTAATISAGTRRPHAGALIAAGHGAVEFPLMVVIVLGAGAVFRVTSVRVGIGLVGGAMLVFMAVQMAMAARRPVEAQPPAAKRGPLMTGIMLTMGNPYYLLWWATVGLALATQAAELGVVAFALFAVIHWLCDLVWLEVLSVASYHGTRVLGRKSQRYVLAGCAAVMALLGGKFIYEGVRTWLAA